MINEISLKSKILCHCPFLKVTAARKSLLTEEAIPKWQIFSCFYHRTLAQRVQGMGGNHQSSLLHVSTCLGRVPG
jgi:hypothetical protein